MASTLVGEYVDGLVAHYRLNLDTYLKIPFTYSIYQGETLTERNGVASPAVKYTTTLLGYNNKRKQTLQLQRVAESDVDTGKRTVPNPKFPDDRTKDITFLATTYVLTFSVFLYDVLWNKLKLNSWELGLYRDLYSFEDVKLITGSLTVAYDNGKYLMQSDQKVTFFMYSPITGKLEYKYDITIKADELDHVEYAQELYNKLIINAREFSNETKLVELWALFSQECLSVSEAYYSEDTADSHSITETIYESDASDMTLLPQRTLFTEVSAPIPRLNRISVLDTGIWSFYPLGSAPAECTARKLGMPFNNKNYTSDFPNAGVTQMLEAAEQDTMYDFISDPLNANVNYADLRSISQAVVSYAKVMAADICSSKYLPRSVVPYVAAKIEYYLFTVKSLPADIEGALTTVLGYILQDYSINDTVANARAYYEKCRDITSFFGTFYTVCGVNVQRLGVNSTNFANVMAEYKEYQRLFLEIAYVRELNQLAITAKSTGSFELLDKTKTIYPRLQSDVYLGMNSQTMICSDVTISITNKPSMSVSANYIKRLEVG